MSRILRATRVMQTAKWIACETPKKDEMIYSLSTVTEPNSVLLFVFLTLSQRFLTTNFWRQLQAIFHPFSLAILDNLALLEYCLFYINIVLATYVCLKNSGIPVCTIGTYQYQFCKRIQNCELLSFVTKNPAV